MLRAGLLRLLVSLGLVVAASGLASCGAPQPATVCAPGLYLYKGGCLTAASQNFVTCTESRGQNLTVEQRTKVEGALDAGIRGSVGGIVELSTSVIEEELPEVAIRIVRDCRELSDAVADPVERQTIEQQVRALDEILGTLSTGTIGLDPDRGPYDQAIGVTGTGWASNVEIEVSAGPSRVRATTDKDGRFETSITLDPNFQNVSPSTVTIRASPVNPSLQLSASALYTVEK